MQPSTGRILHYRLTADNAEQINARYEDTHRNRPMMQEQRPGFQAHIGNRVSEGEIVPMMVVRVWENTEHNVNGQVFLDGNDSLWVTSAKEGDEPGNWSWPPRV